MRRLSKEDLEEIHESLEANRLIQTLAPVACLLITFLALVFATAAGQIEGHGGVDGGGDRSGRGAGDAGAGS